MDFRFTSEVESFRREVTHFLDQEMAPGRTTDDGDDGDLTGLSEEFGRAILRRAGARGFLGISIPSELGGGGRSASHRAAFNLEVSAHDAPLIDTAVTLIAQPLVAWGSPQQQSFFLPRIVAGEIEACIAYTEPGAGSDLGSLTTVAEPDGDDYLLSGIKSLVTGSHKADWCCTIARTRPDVPARDGLSMFLVDMRSEGLTVRHRPTMNRWTLGEMVFDRVRVGPGGLLGQRDQGWRQLVTAVATEGAGMFHIGFAQMALERLIAHVKSMVPSLS